MATQAPLGPSEALLGRGLSKVASGQRLIIYAILLNLVSLFVKGTAGDVAGLAAGIVATVVALVGLFRLAPGMGYAVGWRVLLAVLMVIPLIGLITLVILNSRATKALRAGGYKVGLLGASRQRGQIEPSRLGGGMEYTEEQREGFRSKFRRRRTWRFAGVAAFILVMFLIETRGILAALIVMLVVLVFLLYSWRCPACRTYLGRGMNPKVCPMCGVALQ
jgi:hypothetical protein